MTEVVLSLHSAVVTVDVNVDEYFDADIGGSDGLEISSWTVTDVVFDEDADEAEVAANLDSQIEDALRDLDLTDL